LGVPVHATPSEIKTTFRRLAKIYHPDKNPNGRERFNLILTAYEVLVDPSKRRQYDLKLKYSTTVNHTTGPKTSGPKKNWDFSEAELKRRQYYQENYAQQKKKPKHKATDYPEKKIYNEYKYILFAAPLAVALLMIIINQFDKSETLHKTETTSTSTPSTPDHYISPYTSYFQQPLYEQKNGKLLRISNSSKADAVLCLFTIRKKFVRCAYLKAGFYCDISELPTDSLEIRVLTGSSWNSMKKIPAASVYGSFDSIQGFHSRTQIIKDCDSEIQLQPTFGNEWREISDTAYFKKN
jgi:curved DNA-binding protein CbpA